MATKKSKTSNKSVKASSTKPKTAAKTVKKPELEASKTNTVDKKSDQKLFKGFFTRKYAEKESILTVFKTPKFYGALLSEVLGTMFITLLILSLWPVGLAWSQSSGANVAIYAFAIIAIIASVYALSGACLNPLVTVGMMSTRRMSVIRGVMYIIAEILGAWFGWLIVNAFHLAGGESAMDVPVMAAIGENGFWPVAMLELVGAIIIGFFFARALSFKRSVFTFAAVVTGGIMLAFFVGFIASAAYLGLQNNMVLNPSIAMMLQIFPTAGESFGEIFGGICVALSAYALFPMLGGVVGFYLADFTAKLSGEN
ncbi:aquaporin [Candidatus Saccharibacteria bacterium]|nr:aquaporin [Candidatus Saccharibacteria bacterium]